MPSFEMIYEEDEDVLEVTFEIFEEHFARTLSLNEHIVVYTDMAFSAAWGITFYSYKQLLQVNETYLDGLSPLPAADAQRLLQLFQGPPIGYFLEIADPSALRARIKSPSLQELIQGDES